MLTRRDTLRCAALVAFGVVGFTHLRHLGAAEPLHALVDGALALPLALGSVSVARRLRTGFGQAALCALLFTATLVPGAGIHAEIHSSRTPSAGPVHLEAMRQTDGFGHHVRDAALALPVALLLAAAGLRRRRLSMSPGRPSTPRRRWALAAAAAVFGATLPAPAAFAALPAPFGTPLTIPPVLTGTGITLTAAEADIPILAGAPTRMWTYNGVFPGPTIRVPSGAPVNVTVQNRLDAAGSLTLHHHGNHSTSANDGQPDSHLIAAGADLTYTYGLTEDGAPERPAMQWYHDHRMDLTARNVWMGLAGMVILDPAPGDTAGQALDAALPNGEKYDVPIMLTDRTFDATNQIPYTFDVNGVLGNLILANGVPQPYFEVEPRKYRLRLLNASNTRPYLLSIDNMTMTQIGTESGLLPAPVPRSTLRLDPAERAEVVLDFTSFAGQSVVLRNALGFGPGLAQVMQFRVSPTPVTDPSSVPTSGWPQPPDFGDAVALPSLNEEGNLDHLPRVWLLTQTEIDSPHWTINGREFSSSRIDAKPVLGTIEKWVFVNTTSVEHVVHIHDVDWRILLRTAGVLPSPAVEQEPALPFPPIDPSEAGLKESFLVKPFEVVEVAARFTDHIGVYVFHCHVLEHEDHAMMAQFEVVP